MPNPTIGQYKIVTLCIKGGIGFTNLNKLLLRIQAVFENQCLSYQYLNTSSSPFINANFSWIIENSFLEKLKAAHANVGIEFWVMGEETDARVGFTKISVHLAQYLPNKKAELYHALELRRVRSNFGLSIAKIYVTLSMEEILSSTVYQLKRSTRGQLIKFVDSSGYSKEELKYLNLEQEFVKSAQTPSTSKWKTYKSVLHKKPHSSAAHLPSGDEDDIQRYFCLQLKINYIKWNKTVRREKVFLKFGNTLDNNTVMIEKADGFFIPKLNLDSIVFLISYPWPISKVRGLILHYSPVFLIYRNPDDLLMTASFERNSLCKFSKTETFPSYMLLIGSEKEILAKIYLDITFVNLGDLSPNKKPESVSYKMIKDKNREENPSTSNKPDNPTAFSTLASDFENLHHIFEELNNTAQQMHTGYQKFASIIVPEEDLETEEETTEEISQQDSEIQERPEDPPTTRSFKTQDYEGTSYNLPKQSSKPDRDMNPDNVPKTKDMSPESPMPGPSKLNQDTKPSINEPTPGTSKNFETITTEPTESTASSSKTPKYTEEIIWCEFCKKHHCIKKIYGLIVNITDVQPTYTPVGAESILEQVPGLKEDIAFYKPPVTEKKRVTFSLNTPFAKTRIDQSSDLEIKPKPLKSILKKTSSSFTPKERIQRESRTQSTSITTTGVQTEGTKIKRESRPMASEFSPSINVIKRPCEGCSQYLEVGYGTNVWQDEQLPLWCKDCMIKKCQAELQHTNQSYNAEIRKLNSQITALEEENKACKTATVSKEQYDRLAAIQHNLTMLFAHLYCKEGPLKEEYQEVTKELEKLKDSLQLPKPPAPRDRSPVILKGILDRACKLKSEIEEFRVLNNAAELGRKEEEEAESLAKHSTHTEPRRSARKDRCEACQIIERRMKAEQTFRQPEKTDLKVLLRKRNL